MNLVKKAHKNHNTVRAICNHSVHPFSVYVCLFFAFVLLLFFFVLPFFFLSLHSPIEVVFLLTLDENQISPTTFLITSLDTKYCFNFTIIKARSI